MSDEIPEVTSAYVLKLLTALAEGPIGAALLDLAEGRRRVVVKQNRDGEGWVLEVVPTPNTTYYGQQSRLCGEGQHSFSASGQCINCPAKSSPGLGMYIL